MAVFGTPLVPAAFVPIRLPWMRLPRVPEPDSATPVLPFPEMRLPAPAAEPPTVVRRVKDEDSKSGVGQGAVPAAFVPIRLPCTSCRWCPLLRSAKGAVSGDDVARAAGNAADMLLRAWLVMRMPLCRFGTAPVPSMFVPM